MYQTATRWDLPLCRIIFWKIYDVMLVFVYFLDGLVIDFCYSNLTRETGELKLTSTITLALQANRLIKCASHPKELFETLT